MATGCESLKEEVLKILAHSHSKKTGEKRDLLESKLKSLFVTLNLCPKRAVKRAAKTSKTAQRRQTNKEIKMSAKKSQKSFDNIGPC